MDETTKIQIKEQMKKYNENEFEQYLSDAGWQEWMKEYTEAEDGEEPTEAELNAIEEEQKRLWEEVFEE